MNNKIKDYRINVFFYNNPHLKGAVLKDLHGHRWHMVNIPHIDITCEGIRNGTGAIELTVHSKHDKLLHRKRSVRVIDNQLAVEFKLKNTLHYAQLARVTLAVAGKTYTLDQKLSVHRIHGRVTDFSGKPIQAYIWAIPTREMPALAKKIFAGTVVKADRNGKYELWLPEENITGIFVDDETYHKTTYECWLWNINLKRDVKINPRIDKAELYNMQVWQAYLGQNILHVHFIPCSFSTYGNKRLKLSEKNIRVFANNKKCKIKALTEHHPWKMSSEPSYILDTEVEKFDSKNTIIRVEVDINTKIGKKVIKEKGEAFFLGFYR